MMPQAIKRCIHSHLGSECYNQENDCGVLTPAPGLPVDISVPFTVVVTKWPTELASTSAISAFWGPCPLTTEEESKGGHLTHSCPGKFWLKGFKVLSRKIEPEI